MSSELLFDIPPPSCYRTEVTSVRIYLSSELEEPPRDVLATVQAVQTSADRVRVREMRDDIHVASHLRGVLFSSLRTFSDEIASVATLPRNDGKATMEIGETLYVTNRDDFRKWLIPNHQVKKEIWLIQYKKATKKPSINYVEAVEEAICFGWIDGLEKSMDAERYALRFSPRRAKSNWTETNKDRARKMIAEGRMMEAGLATLPKDF